MPGTTLAKLPKQPLLDRRTVGPAFSTIWLIVFLVFYVLFTKGRRRESYGIIGYASLLLAIMYLFNSVDGWLHHTKTSVTFGYILVHPFAEAFGVTSTLLLLWGTFRIIWDELVDRFPSIREQRFWWFAAKFTIFVISLISIYYTALFLALAAAWVRFMSLNTINDIATKRTGFEIAKGSFNFAFTLLVLAASSLTFLWKAKKFEGRRPLNRVWTGWLGTLFLCVRSLIEFALILAVYWPQVTRRDVQLTRDIYHGLLTGLYMICMYSMAHVVSQPHDASGPDARAVEAALRKHILEKLDRETKHPDRDAESSGFETRHGRLEARRFDLVLKDVAQSLPELLQDLVKDRALVNAETERKARKYIRILENEFGQLDPKVMARQERDRNLSRSYAPSKASLQSESTRHGRHSLNNFSKSAIGLVQAPNNPDARPRIPKPQRTNHHQPFGTFRQEIQDPNLDPQHHGRSSHWHRVGDYNSPEASAIPSQFGASRTNSNAATYNGGTSRQGQTEGIPWSRRQSRRNGGSGGRNLNELP
ncbi:hypothetical protein PFICI_13053 [Pestalotiopsis fici W106-1]|uniref:Uncharacterized protein n=1 Tax=Pestalotiopsis fici (strain W106-1 / CGMCC3.15140) TaxID=1229662 RepID=W3WLC9_PESFW|nr:uncharacterized protein PFICI_13053 [Pestalotiopsis fici W106-1]ETS74569.1 hypothetical protein PFICI_13053 [Pestalotiopsis fici W106-1]